MVGKAGLAGLAWRNTFSKKILQHVATIDNFRQASCVVMFSSRKKAQLLQGNLDESEILEINLMPGQLKY